LFRTSFSRSIVLVFCTRPADVFIAHGLKGISDCQQRIGGKRNDGLRKIQRERESRGEGCAVVQDSKHLKINSEICGVLDVRYLLLPMTGKK
jgi:hypothetical protein